jgi:hypothetical protein
MPSVVFGFGALQALLLTTATQRDRYVSGMKHCRQKAVAVCYVSV